MRWRRCVPCESACRSGSCREISCPTPCCLSAVRSPEAAAFLWHRRPVPAGRFSVLRPGPAHAPVSGEAVPGHIPVPCRIEIYPDSAARGGSRTGGTGIEISQADHRAHRRLRTACRQTAGNPHGDGTHSRFRSRCGWGLAGCGTGSGGLFSGYRSAGGGSSHAGRHSGRPAAAADPFTLLRRNGGDQSGHHLHRP